MSNRGSRGEQTEPREVEAELKTVDGDEATVQQQQARQGSRYRRTSTVQAVGGGLNWRGNIKIHGWIGLIERNAYSGAERGCTTFTLYLELLDLCLGDLGDN
jgi:hypothetical protein